MLPLTANSAPPLFLFMPSTGFFDLARIEAASKMAIFSTVVPSCDKSVKGRLCLSLSLSLSLLAC